MSKSTVSHDFNTDKNLPIMVLEEYVPHWNPQFGRNISQALAGWVSSATDKLASIAGGEGLLGRSVQAAATAAYSGDAFDSGLEAGTKYIDDAISGERIGIFRVPCYKFNPIEVDTTSQWTHTASSQRLVDSLSINIPTQPYWKNTRDGRSMENQFDLVNRNEEEAVGNFNALRSLSYGMYWRQLSWISASPHFYKVKIISGAGGKSIIDFKWSVCGMSVSMLGQVRGGYPEAYRVQIKVKSLLPNSLNSVVSDPSGVQRSAQDPLVGAAKETLDSVNKFASSLFG